jgi:hypothetical protein
MLCGISVTASYGGGEPEDRLAWRALAGSVGKGEIILEKQKIAAFRGGEKTKQKLKEDPGFYATVVESSWF